MKKHKYVELSLSSLARHWLIHDENKFWCDFTQNAIFALYPAGRDRPKWTICLPALDANGICDKVVGKYGDGFDHCRVGLAYDVKSSDGWLVFRHTGLGEEPVRSFEHYWQARDFVVDVGHPWFGIYPMKQAMAESLA